jgi:hypothetical protein
MAAITINGSGFATANVIVFIVFNDDVRGGGSLC